MPHTYDLDVCEKIYYALGTKTNLTAVRMESGCGFEFTRKDAKDGPTSGLSVEIDPEEATGHVVVPATKAEETAKQLIRAGCEVLPVSFASGEATVAVPFAQCPLRTDEQINDFLKVMTNGKKI